MKSILQSVILYARANELQKLDDQDKEIIRSYIYTYWLLRFSEHPQGVELNVGAVMCDLWSLTVEVFREGGWSPQHHSIASYFLSVSATTSLDCLRRLSKVTTVPVNLEKAEGELNRVFQRQSHSFGNALASRLD